MELKDLPFDSCLKYKDSNGMEWKLHSNNADLYQYNDDLGKRVFFNSFYSLKEIAQLTFTASIDWDTVLEDTKVFVKNNNSDLWEKRYFAKYENGYVYTFADGRTKWNADKVEPWKYSILVK